MEKEKLKILIEMLEREIEEIANLPKVGIHVISAICLLDNIKSAILNDETIDLEKVQANLTDFEKLKRKSEKDILKDIQNSDLDTLNQLSSIMTVNYVSELEDDDKPISKEDFHQLKDYFLFSLKNGLVGNPIQSIEYNGYCAVQFQNFNILFTKDNGEGMFCRYFKKATKQDLKRLIDDIKMKK